MGDSTGVVDVGADGVLLLSTVEGEVAGSEQPESTKAITLSPATMPPAILPFMIYPCAGIRLLSSSIGCQTRDVLGSTIRRSFRDQSSTARGRPGLSGGVAQLRLV